MKISFPEKNLLFISFIILAITISIAVYWFTSVYEKDRALVAAAGNGDIQQVEKLLASGSYSIDGRANDDWTALAIASNKGHYEMVKYLLDSGADVNATSGGGKTALFWANYNKHTKIEALLKEHGAK